jgi:hypothetical protein
MLREKIKKSVRIGETEPKVWVSFNRLWPNDSQTKRVSRIARRTSFARSLGLLTVLSVPPLWSEIAILHYRGSFQSRYMWLPIITLPVIMAGGVISVLNPDERRSRHIFRPFALFMTVLGLMGTFFHLRGVRRQMGGFRNWKYNIMTGPPFPAPMQIMLTGLLATAASAAPARDETQRLVCLVHVINIASYLLFAVEAGWNHWIGEYFNKVMFVPIILSPILAVMHMAALKAPPTKRSWQLRLSAVAVVVGLIGFGFHIRNINRRQGGFSWQNFFYGPPVAAPLQLTALGIEGVLAAYYENLE